MNKVNISYFFKRNNKHVLLEKETLKHFGRKYVITR